MVVVDDENGFGWPLKTAVVTFIVIGVLIYSGHGKMSRVHGSDGRPCRCVSFPALFYIDVHFFFFSCLVVVHVWMDFNQVVVVHGMQ